MTPYDAFIVDQQRRGLRGTTIAKRKRLLWAFRGSLKSRYLLDATAEDIQRWLDSHHLAPRARYVYLSHLHTFYDFAAREGMIPEDPTARIVRPKLPRNIPRPIADRDLKYALAQAEPEMKAMLCLGAFEGFRCQEIAGLQREDVLEHQDPPLIVVSHGKGGRERVLPLNAEVERSLRVHGLPRSGPVFLSTRGAPYAPNTVTHKISKFFRSIGVNATAHQLRHSFGSRLYRETMDLRLVQECLGHSNPQTTAIYAQWNPTKAAEVVRFLGVNGTDPPKAREPSPERDGSS